LCDVMAADDRQYGGNFAWTGVPYKMSVDRGMSPLQWLNGLTQHVLDLSNLILEVDGGFRRPGENTSLFPVRGLRL